MDSFNLRAAIPSDNLVKDSQFLIQLFDLELILESERQIVLSRSNSEFALYFSENCHQSEIKFCLTYNEENIEDLIKRYQFVCYANEVQPNYKVDKKLETLELKDYLGRSWEVHFQKNLQ